MTIEVLDRLGLAMVGADAGAGISINPGRGPLEHDI